jgi:hypothetical protein
MVGIEGQHQCAISITGKRSASKQKQEIVEMFWVWLLWNDGPGGV